MTAIENNLGRKTKEEMFKKMLIEAMASHRFLAKNFFEFHLKKYGNLAFLDISNFGSNCGE